MGVAILALALASASPIAQPALDGDAARAVQPSAVEDFLARVGGTFEERQARLTLSSGVPLTLTLFLQPDHVDHAERIIDAAREALEQYSEWFAPYPHDRLAIVDVPWRSEGAGSSSYPAFITVKARWWQPERSFTLEAQVARGIARQWWGGIVGIEDRFLADGLAEYAQSRTLERIYDRRHQRMAYSMYETRIFGGLVPWAIRALRLDRQTSGVGRSAFRRHPDVDLRDQSEAVRPAQTAKTATALVTLERYLGWPVLQRGLSSASKRFAGQVMTTDAFAATLSGAANRDLSWFFGQAFRTRSTFDYAVGRLSSEMEASDACGASPCYRSTIVVSRLGDALFTGTNLEPVGEFEAGRANEIRVSFADGQQAVDHWDGRALSKTLVYVGAAPAVSAHIDPRRVLLLDVNSINNARTSATPAASATLPWSVRWTTWVQDTILTHAFFF